MMMRKMLPENDFVGCREGVKGQVEMKALTRACLTTFPESFTVVLCTAVGFGGLRKFENARMHVVLRQVAAEVRNSG